MADSIDITYLLKLIAEESDERAFRDLYNYFSPKLIELASYYTNSNQLAGEVVSDVFVKIWRNRQSLKKINDIRSYLFVATKRQSISAIRRENQKFLSVETLKLDITAESTSPDQKLLTQEFLDFFTESIKKLPAKTQLIFKMIKEEGIKYKEVAQLLNLSEKAIEKHMTNALKNLRKQIETYRETNNRLTSERHH